MPCLTRSDCKGRLKRPNTPSKFITRETWTSKPRASYTLAIQIATNTGDGALLLLVSSVPGELASGVYAGDPSKLSMKAAFGRVWRLEDIGGSIIGGSLALLKQKQANPPPPRDE